MNPGKYRKKVSASWRSTYIHLSTSGHALVGRMACLVGQQRKKMAIKYSLFPCICFFLLLLRTLPLSLFSLPSSPQFPSSSHLSSDSHTKLGCLYPFTLPFCIPSFERPQLTATVEPNMEHHTSKEEKAIGAEASFVDTVPETEEYSNILERKNMSKREFYWLWAGYVIFFLTPPLLSVHQPPLSKKIDPTRSHTTKNYTHCSCCCASLSSCLLTLLSLSFSLSKQTNIVFSSKPYAFRSKHA